MRTMIFLLVLSLFLAGCGPTDSAIQTAIAETQEAQTSTSPEPTRPIDQDTPAAETNPTIGAGRPTETPLPPTSEPTQPVESQEVQSQSHVPSLVWSSGVEQPDHMSFRTAGGRLFLIYKGYQVRIVDIGSGSDLWVLDLASPSFHADADFVYTWPFELRMDALDANTGELRWSHLSQEPLGAVVASDDKVVVLAGTSKNVLHVIDKSDGSLIASSEVNNSGLGGWEQQGNHLVYGSSFGFFVSELGQFIWPVQGVWFWKFCDGMFVYASSAPLGQLHAIDVNTFDSLWTSDVARDHRIRIDETIWCGTENIYVRVDNQVRALSKDTGELRWTGPIASQFSRNVATDSDLWLGEVAGTHVYSHLGYGMTRAYDAVDHSLIWENPQVVLRQVVGVTDDTLIGVLWEPRSGSRRPVGIAVGLDSRTGTELWRRDIGTDDYGGTYVQLMHGRLLYVSPDAPGIKFVDPRSGDLIVEIPLKKHWSTYFSSTDGMIVVANRKEQVIIRP